MGNGLYVSRDTMMLTHEERERAEAERDAAQDELATWLAGGLFAQVWHVLAHRRGRP